jgi:hypothetical protein
LEYYNGSGWCGIATVAGAWLNPLILLEYLCLVWRWGFRPL